MRCDLRFYSKFGITFFLLFFCSFTIKADLPVHCKREQIEGEWILRINSDVFTPDLNDYRTSCGHGFPDKIEKNVGDENFTFDSYKDVSLVLSKDYKIYKPNSTNVVGKWTPVYDEGFIVYYKNFVFTAFMKYFLKQKTNSPKPSNSLYLSNCDKTMIGWVIHDKMENNKNWSCFFGFKSKIKNEFSKDSKKSFLKPNNNFNRFDYINTNSNFNNNNDNNKNNVMNSSLNTNELNFNFGNNKIDNNEWLLDINFFDNLDSNENQEDRENESFLELKTKNKSNSQMKLWMSRYEEQMEIVNEINSNNLSWKAEINDEFKGLSFVQLKEKIGTKNKKSSNLNFFNNKNLIKNHINNNNLNNNKQFQFDNFDTEINDDYDINNFTKNLQEIKPNLSNQNNENFDLYSLSNNDFLDFNTQEINSNSVSGK